MKISKNHFTSLRLLAKAENNCKRCSLYRKATQAVPGQGPPTARFMLVGEQPGDKEDISGKPFVGPAGRILDAALGDAGIARGDAYITNAVKHFKHDRRGKRRLHKRPNNSEIESCKFWLDIERRLVKPSTIIALGASAARSLTGKTMIIANSRGKPQRFDDGTVLVVTIHPSSLLRLRDEVDKRAAYKAFVSDLRRAASVTSLAAQSF